MRYNVKYRPSYSLLEVELDPGEAITAEAGAMTYMTPNIRVVTRTRKGVFGSLLLSLLGGQSFFVNDYIAEGGRGKIGLVAAPIGDIEILKLSGSGYIIQKSAYLASSPTINLDTEWQGFKRGIFGQGLFMLKTSGYGLLFINVFGAIDKHVLGPGERLIVDNFHLVAFSDTCNYDVRTIGGLKGLMFSGEGVIVEIEGPGEVYLQTKNLREFAQWLWPILSHYVQKAR